MDESNTVRDYPDQSNSQFDDNPESKSMIDEPSKSDITESVVPPKPSDRPEDKPAEEGPPEEKNDQQEVMPHKKKSCLAGCSCSKCTPPGGTKEAIFNIWDGMQMIRYDYYELPRFYGSEPRWYDKFKSLKWVSCTLIITILFLVIVFRELSSIGTMKAQTLEINYQPSFQYEIKDSLMPLKATQYFLADELTNKLKNDVTNDDPALNSILSKKPGNLPLKFAQYTDAHKKWLEEILCAAVKVSYQENEQILVVNQQGYNLTTKLGFECEVLQFADDKIRMNFFISPDSVAQVFDTRTPNEVSDSTVIQFKRSSNFRQGVYVKYSREFWGLTSTFQLYHTVYQDWNIYSPLNFDSMQISPDTHTLMMTPEFKINRRSVERATIKVSSVKTIMKESVSGKKVLGVTTQWNNETSEALFFQKNDNLDNDGRVPLHATLVDDQVSVDMDFDFQQRVITYHLIQFKDAFAVMGGILAALKPIFGLTTPFFIWYFLLMVAKTVKENHSRQYRDGLNSIFLKSMNQLRKIKEISNLQYDDWQFLDPETIDQLDNYLLHGADSEVEGDPEHFLNENEYPSDRLHEILNDILAFISRIQKATVQNKDSIVTGEYVNVADIKDEIPIEDQITPGEPPGEPAEEAEGGEQEMFTDLNLHEVNAEEIMTKYADYSTVAKLHHRRVHYDIVFTKTEELTKMEPLADQLNLLKSQNDLNAIQIVGNIKKRLSFFSLYQLFDRVETSESSTISTNHMLIQHIKRQDQELAILRKALVRLEPLQVLMQDGNYEKIMSMVYGEGGSPSASPLKEDLNESKDSVYMRKSSFQNLHMANEQIFEHLNQQLIEQRDMLEKMQQQAAATAAAAQKKGTTPSGMSFDPINEEENEDGESGHGKLPRASAKAVGDDGNVELEDAFSDEEKAKKDKKKKKDKSEKKEKKKKSSKGDSDGRSKSKSKSQRSKSKSKQGGTEDGHSQKSGKTAGGGSQQEEGGERISAKSKVSHYSTKSKMKMEGGNRERSRSKKFDNLPRRETDEYIDSTRKLIN